MSSKRAEILKQLLPHIATDNYDEYEGYIIFGASSVFDMIDDIAAQFSKREDDSRVKAVRELVSDLTQHRGRTGVARRISLHQPPRFKATSKQSRLLLEALKQHLGPVETESIPGSNGEDAIDAALTEEVLGKLPKMVDRTLSLDDVRLDGVLRKDVKCYFYEAHRCYLYGFPVACAVLCRATLEFALRTVCDPTDKIRKAVDRKKVELKKDISYFEELIKEAETIGRLTNSHRECAFAVRDAGNAAIHDFPKFEQRWLNGLNKIVDSTRWVLLDLYAA